MDGQSLRGFNNHQAVEVLRSTGQVVRLTLARYLRGPKYDQLQQAMAESGLAAATAAAAAAAASVSAGPVTTPAAAVSITPAPSYRPPSPPPPYPPPAPVSPPPALPVLQHEELSASQNEQQQQQQHLPPPSVDGDESILLPAPISFLSGGGPAKGVDHHPPADDSLDASLRLSQVPVRKNKVTTLNSLFTLFLCCMSGI